MFGGRSILLNDEVGKALKLETYPTSVDGVRGN